MSRSDALRAIMLRDDAPPLGLRVMAPAVAGLVRRNFATLSMLGLLIAGLPSALNAALPIAAMLAMRAAGPGHALSAAAMAQLGALQSLSGLILFVIHPVLLAGVTHVAAADRDGWRASFGASLWAGLRVMFPIVGLSMVAGLGALCGAVLLVVPGVVMYLNWIVAVPVRVMEGPGTRRALDRSRALMRGNRWRCLGLLVLTSLAAAALSAAAGLASSLVGGGLRAVGLGVGGLATVCLTTAASTIGALLSAVTIAVVYGQLSRAKQFAGVERMAAVFG